LQHSGGYHYKSQHALRMHTASSSLFPAFDVCTVCVLGAAHNALFCRSHVAAPFSSTCVAGKGPTPTFLCLTDGTGSAVVLRIIRSDSICLQTFDMLACTPRNAGKGPAPTSIRLADCSGSAVVRRITP
jgi:hypothetical protein